MQAFTGLRLLAAFLIIPPRPPLEEMIICAEEELCKYEAMKPLLKQDFTFIIDTAAETSKVGLCGLLPPPQAHPRTPDRSKLSLSCHRSRAHQLAHVRITEAIWIRGGSLS